MIFETKKVTLHKTRDLRAAYKKHLIFVVDKHVLSEQLEYLKRDT